MDAWTFMVDRSRKFVSRRCAPARSRAILAGKDDETNGPAHCPLPPKLFPPWLLLEGRYFLELHPLARVRARESFDAFGVLAGRPGKPFSAFAGRDKLGGKE
jgi:hypothetical protein